MAVGIVGYGAYVPFYRIKVEEIAKVWKKDPEGIKNGLNICEKSVPSLDEDTATISVSAARSALKRAEIDPSDIGAIYVGSESHPYVVKSTSAIVGEAIEASPHFTAADLEFACKAGTAGIQACMGLVKAGYINYGLAIGADTAQGRPGDALEYSAAAGGAAYIIGKDNLIAEIEDTVSYTTDTPDFWRREGEEYPRHGGRFTGIPAYFKHIKGAVKSLLEKTGQNLYDYDYVVFHQPNGKFPIKMAKQLGIERSKTEQGLLVTRIGNTYSGAVPLALASVLDVAKPGDLILVVSYGSGAGSDAFSIKVTKNIDKNRSKAPLVKEYIENKCYLCYGEYVKHRGKLKM